MTSQDDDPDTDVPPTRLVRLEVPDARAWTPPLVRLLPRPVLHDLDEVPRPQRRWASRRRR